MKCITECIFYTSLTHFDASVFWPLVLKYREGPSAHISKFDCTGDFRYIINLLVVINIYWNDPSHP